MELRWTVEIARHTPRARGEWRPIGDINDLRTVRFEWVRLPKAPKQFRGMLPRRWVAERTIAWLHRYKCLLIRYERRDDIPQALLDLGCSLICLRRLQEAVQ